MAINVKSSFANPIRPTIEEEEVCAADDYDEADEVPFDGVEFTETVT